MIFKNIKVNNMKLEILDNLNYDKAKLKGKGHYTEFESNILRS
jgi:hypothetical protein